MASKACLKDGKWTPRLAFSFVITFHGLWGTFLGKPSWNEPKTLKPYFSVWPKATVRGFDVSVLIWSKLHQELDMKCVFRQLISGRWVWPYSPLLSGECRSTMRIFWPSTQRSKHSPWISPPPPPTRPLPQICLRRSEIWSQKCSSKIRRKGLL